MRNKDNQTSKDLEEMTSELGNMRDNYSKVLLTCAYNFVLPHMRILLVIKGEIGTTTLCG